MKRTWPSIEEFYAEDERRGRSPEMDFGTWWSEDGGWPVWRVTAVRETGEVYAVCVTTCAYVGQVELIATLTGGSYEPAKELLAGWVDHIHDHDGLHWVREQAHRAGVAA